MTILLIVIMLFSLAVLVGFLLARAEREYQQMSDEWRAWHDQINEVNGSGRI